MCDTSEDFQAARQQLGLAVARGNAGAQCTLGHMHQVGRGGPQDSAEARRLLGLSAAQGYIGAQVILAHQHRLGDGGPKDFAEARRLYELAAAQGRADAQYTLGHMHRKGEGGPVDYAEARRMYGLAVAQGHAKAQHALGDMHHNGEGGPVDFAEARRLYGLAAAQGDAGAQCKLGNMHLLAGKGGPKDPAEARRLLGLAAAQGYAEAQLILGTMHRVGQGGPSLAEARRLLGLAAAQGYAHAQYHLGVMHGTGEGGPIDLAEAKRLFGLAAAQGDAGATRMLGDMHRTGEGGLEDFAEARRLYGLAVAQGDAGAQYALGRMHHDGEGEPADFAEARRLLGLAAAQGHANAQHALGDMHCDGEGGPQDFAEARWLYGLSAAQGHAMAQCLLGHMHRGEGRPVDFAEARRLYGLAAAQGDAGAQYALGGMHRDGEGEPADLVEARRLYGLAAAQGDASAQCMLASMHYKGEGGLVDFAEARRLFGHAAAQGDANAQFTLGSMQFSGQGGPVDFAEARRLFGLAAAQGDANAQSMLGLMHRRGEGGPVDFAEARRLCGLSAAHGSAEAQNILGHMHRTGEGGPQDFAEARRLYGLAVTQGHAKAQYNLASMHHKGEGGPVDFAETRRLYGLSAAQGHALAQQSLALLDRAMEAQLAKEHADADAMMAKLLAEDAEEKKAKGAPKSTKSAKGKKITMSCTAAAQTSPAISAAPLTPPSSGATVAETAAASDAALRDAMTAGEFEALSAALEVHRRLASEGVLREARTLRDRLKERRKQKSQRQRRSHAGAMEALSRLQGCATDADALLAGIAAAEAHAGELPALDAELDAARARLEGLSVGHSAASAAAPASEAAPLAGSDEASQVLDAQAAAPLPAAAVSLTLAELVAATGNFGKQKLIGSGGYGRVFSADALPSLPPEAVPPRLRHLPVAVKRAKSGAYNLTDLQREVSVLQQCNHPHLLPLLGYYLSELDSPCLVFPLMRGGSFADRLFPSKADPKHLHRLGLSAPLCPLRWHERVGILQQATDALLYLHSAVLGGKGAVVHRDFKPENILLDDELNAYLADTGFAKMDSGLEVSKQKSVSNALYLTLGYLDPSIVAGGDYSATTDGWALGITMLVALTSRSPLQIVENCEEDLDEDFEAIEAVKLADAEAGWPTHVATAIKDLVRSTQKGLCQGTRNRKRLAVADALTTLTRLAAEGADDLGEWHERKKKSAPAQQQPPLFPVAGATLPPDSLKVMVGRTKLPQANEGKQREEDLVRQIQESWGNIYSSLAAIYQGATGERPPQLDADKGINDYYRKLHFPSRLKEDLHTLRRWRNAAEHGVENEDGTFSPWVDRPQGGGLRSAPALPARETIKQLIASIDGGWLAERRALLLQE